MRLIAPLTIAALLALAGCSSTSTKVDSGPVRARTFSFVASDARRAPAGTDTESVVNANIHEAIARNLTNRGLKQVDGVGDVVVGYLLILGNNVSTTAITEYFGQGRDSSALQDKAQKAYTGSRNPNIFEAGTLVVDLIDAKTFKLLWRQHVSRPALQKPTAEERAKHIGGAVDELFRELRIAP
jgi:hypothetical protein